MQRTVRVLATLALLGRDQTWLTRASRLGANTIGRLLHDPSAEPSERTIERVSATLGVAPSWLTRDAGVPRPLTVSETAELQRAVDLLRRLIRGDRLDARAHPNAHKTTHRMSPALRRAGARIVCQVKGNSMIDAGFRDGDLAHIAPQTNVRQLVGSIVLAQLNGALFLKLLRVEQGGIPTLYSAAAGYEPIRIQDGDDFRVLGRIVTAVRHYA